MSFTELILIRRLSIGVVGLSLLFVLTLGVGIMWRAFSVPPESLVDFGPVGQQRSVASIAVIDADAPPILSANRKARVLETIELACIKNTHEYNLQTTAKQVRLRGRLCVGAELNMAETSVVNRASGVGATLFSLDNNRFTSDYLSLSAGVNDLWVQLQAKDGKSYFAQVTILRILE